MSIATQLNKYMNGLKDSYDALWYQYPTMPAHKNLANLPSTVQTIYGIPRDVDVDGYWTRDMALSSYAVPEQVVEIGDRAYEMAFEDITALTSFDFSNTEQIDDGGCLRICDGCTNLASLDVSSLETVNEQGLYYAFSDCASIASVSFSSLSAVGKKALYACFSGCTSLTTLSFPALTASSFDSSTDQFDLMLYGCSDVTVHFPASIQSTIGSWTSVTNGFSGTNTTVLFDL